MEVDCFETVPLKTDQREVLLLAGTWGSTVKRMNKIPVDIGLQKPTAQTGVIQIHEPNHTKNSFAGRIEGRDLGVRGIVMPRNPNAASKTCVFHAVTIARYSAISSADR